mgnify:CR=1 FL=1
MTPERYIGAVRAVLDHLEKSQLPAIERAADLVIAALSGGGAVYCAGIGHGNEADFINRAGGLAAVQQFSFNFNVNSPTAECLKDRPRAAPFEKDLEAVRLAVRGSSLRAGDAMLAGSVSGRTVHAVELAMACRDIGVKVIGFTSLAYTKRVEPGHPSGRKLCDVADVVIDNGAPYGDAAVDVPGYAEKMLPVSGVSSIVAGWMLWGRVMEKMAAAGNPPGTFISVNRKDGKDYYEKSKARFNKRGY